MFVDFIASYFAKCIIICSSKLCLFGFNYFIKKNFINSTHFIFIEPVAVIAKYTIVTTIITKIYAIFIEFIANFMFFLQFMIINFKLKKIIVDEIN